MNRQQEVVVTHDEAVADSTVVLDMTGYSSLVLLVTYDGSTTGGFARAFARATEGGANTAHGDVTNEKTSNTSTNYDTIYHNCPVYMAVALDWVDGKITVTAIKVP